MVVPDWIWFVFLFAFGCCVGSFLNVVIYRLPRDKSIVTPPSACPACGKHIRFYDNIPLLSWLILRAKCRYCKAPISPRYFIIELFTGLLFVALFIVYFRTGLRAGLGSFCSGGWLIYLVSVVLLAAFTAASAIDLELWIIPLSICWFVTVVGFIGSAIGGYIIDLSKIRAYWLLPSASPKTGSLAVGALIGLAVSWILLIIGLIKRSYESCNSACDSNHESPSTNHEPLINHRLEACKEIIFLLPIIIFSAAAFWIINQSTGTQKWWSDFSQRPVIAGFLGSLWGYFVGCGIVWSTRIIGTLAFGKEAMGLGDVHLMGAAGAVIGPVFVIVAFFIAPFLGLAWAAFQMFFRKTRQIPYGPFLSLAVFAVMILHDWFLNYLGFMFEH